MRCYHGYGLVALVQCGEGLEGRAFACGGGGAEGGVGGLAGLLAVVVVVGDPVEGDELDLRRGKEGGAGM